jgi:hypothetical protein
MIKNIRNQYKNISVPLDNNEFVECQFEGCTMEFSGLGPVSMVGCKFTNVRWVFLGAAQNTLNFLHGLYHGMGDGGRLLVESTFDNIRRPTKAA